MNYFNKMISSEIINYLTPMSIAFLLMDDGGWVALVYTLALGCVCTLGHLCNI
jgi:hypothetical protein